MHDEEHDDDPEWRRDQEDAAVLAAYDSWISRSLTTVELIGDLATFAAERDVLPKSRQLATGWIRLGHPNSDFLAALRRLGRVSEVEDDRVLQLRSPIMCESWVMHCWCTSVTSALSNLLQDEANYISNILSVGSRTSLTPRADGR